MIGFGELNEEFGKLPPYSFPRRGHHYGIYTCDHIIDVISNDKPQITIIE